MRKIFQAAADYLQMNKDIVLVMIVEQKGSVPRGAGAAMIVSETGRIAGTIGGGAVEYQAECLAKDLLKHQHSETKKFYLKPNQIQDLGMVCGGDVTVTFRYINSNDDYNIDLFNLALNLYDKREEFWIILDTDEREHSAITFYSGTEGAHGWKIPDKLSEQVKSRYALEEAEGRKYFWFQLQDTSRVYIFGGGHVSQALVPALSAVDFKCIVLEDREEFCTKELFPQAEAVRLIDIKNISDFIEITDKDYICIMTRGHKDDLEVQDQVLRTKACYIGVIGSRRKKAAVFAELKKRGFTDNDLKRVITPIGLDIGAKTPAEIAVSITAQMIQKRSDLYMKK